MQLQEKMQSKGFSSGDSFKTTSVLNPQEAAIFASTHLSKQKIADMQNNVAQLKETLKKAAERKQAEVKKEEESATPGTSMLPEEIEEKKSLTFEYIPGPPIGGRRVRKAFDFVEKGTFEKQAQKERLQAKLSELQNSISTAAKQTGISSAVRLALVTPASAEVSDDLPDIEWWDRVLLNDAQNYNEIPSPTLPPNERYVNTVTNLIEHPVQLKPPNAALEKVCIKTHLTKKEMKRLRRMNRREAQREEQEKIRLGLMPVPEPKVKMANLMRVLGNEAIQDPTKMEAFARKQEEERLKKHLDANAERKLTKEQKADKKTRKIMEDTSVVVYVAVYKILSLANPSKRFKALINAKQLQMTGLAVSVDDMNVIVVEGGPKQQRHYKQLMLNRINWGEELVGQKKGVAKEEDEGQRNECTLVWEGTVPKREFTYEPKLQTATDHRSAREVFAKYNVPHYWDYCFSLE
ncbi:Pre-mRNA processing factor 3 [Aphelenchoides bicaudatus]|nr:Pre-mRNA processing factor 3 [Aphelenchoides bicaudatus]